MDNEALQEPEDITNDMPIDISWEELEHMTDGFSDERKIGSGGYGVVYKGVQENGKKIAVKKLYHMPGLDEKQFQNEIQILTRLEHRNIVRLIGQIYKEQERCVEYNGNLVCAKMVDRVICLEYLHNGSLEKHLSEESSGLPWHKRYKIIKGICEGLNYLHEHSIFHLDLKPGNILLDDNMLPKIADFGVSRLFSGTRKSHTTTHFIGTPGFMPPEYIEKLKISDKYDVFSLGVIIILIMSGPNGYSRQSDMASPDFIELVHGNWMTRLPKPESGDASYSDAHSNQVKTCIMIALNCLESDRHKRPSIGDIIQSLNESETTIGESIKRVDDSAKASSSAAFNSELTALARANHKNVVCVLGSWRVVVHENMANGTLHDQLHSRSPMAGALSSWRGRLTIALGAARGIEYMHVHAVPPVIHRDIKSANILLDDAWTAKIAAYPEYYRLQQLRDKSDVYSFGVVLLELVSGCRVVQRYAESVEPKNVVEFAVPHVLADDVACVLDPRLSAPMPAEAEALAYVGYLAADCVGPVGCDRPSMTEVVDALERAVAACRKARLTRIKIDNDEDSVVNQSQKQGVNPGLRWWPFKWRRRWKKV